MANTTETGLRRVASAALIACLVAAVGCGARDPFRYARVTGDVRYRDGQRLTCPSLRLTFHPLQPPKNSRTHPRHGTATVDVSTGRFTAATTRRPGDGLVRGRHKVVVRTIDGVALPIDVLGPEYADPTTSPLEIDTDSLPLEIRVHRPTLVPLRGTVVHEDGSPVLMPDAVCTFFVPVADGRLRDFREIGSARVDGKTGGFSSVSRVNDAGDDLFVGTYRVTIRGADGEPLPATAVPAVYADPRTTPLQIDVASSPVTLAIRKP